MSGRVVVSGTLAQLAALLGSGGTSTITYTPDTDTPPADVTLTLSVDDGGNGGGAAQTGSSSVTLAITAVDDAPVAVADAVTITEPSTVRIAATANDTDVDGGKGVIGVRGLLIAGGGVATLPSGATVTLSGGELLYDPKGKFAYLVAADGASTGAQTTSIDSFTYTLNGLSTATVTVTITGVDGAGDELRGSAAADTIGGTSGADTIVITQVGSDRVAAGAGNDGIYVGGSLDATDGIDGGAGAGDTLILAGDYSAGLTISAAMLTNVEVVVAKAGTSYSLSVPQNLTVEAGRLLTIYVSEVTAAHSFAFNGAGMTDGARVFAGGGADTIVIGGGNDGVHFGPGKWNPLTDTADGGNGNDQIAFDGSYPNLVLDGTRIVNFETVVLIAGPAASPSSFDVTVNADFVTAGERTI